MTWLWWAPLGAAALHIVEEFVWPGGFAEWDRAYRPEIRASITSRMHVIVNALLLVACATVGIAGMPGSVVDVGGLHLHPAIPASLAAPGWLALAALLFSNAMFHVLGTWQTKRVSPGVRTGVALYVPMTLFGYWHFLGTGLVSVPMAILAALVGGSYHLWAALAHRWRARGAEGRVQ
jgi:hypothetical protein